LKATGSSCLARLCCVSRERNWDFRRCRRAVARLVTDDSRARLLRRCTPLPRRMTMKRYW